jgi:hypothetical protein
VNWSDTHGWFQWRSVQQEAVHRVADGSRFVAVGTFLGGSLCSLGAGADGARIQPADPAWLLLTAHASIH